MSRFNFFQPIAVVRFPYRRRDEPKALTLWMSQSSFSLQA